MNEHKPRHLARVTWKDIADKIAGAIAFIVISMVMAYPVLWLALEAPLPDEVSPQEYSTQYASNHGQPGQDGR